MHILSTVTIVGTIRGYYDLTYIFLLDNRIERLFISDYNSELLY